MSLVNLINEKGIPEVEALPSEAQGELQLLLHWEPREGEWGREGDVFNSSHTPTKSTSARFTTNNGAVNVCIDRQQALESKDAMVLLAEAIEEYSIPPWPHEGEDDDDLLCCSFPNVFGIFFLNYTHTLHFDDKPDYSYLHHLSMCEGYMYIFDWGVQKGTQDDGSTGVARKKTTRCKVVQDEDHHASSQM